MIDTLRAFSTRKARGRPKLFVLTNRDQIAPAAAKRPRVLQFGHVRFRITAKGGCRDVARVPSQPASVTASAPPVNVEGGNTDVTVTVVGEAVLDQPRAR